MGSVISVEDKRVTEYRTKYWAAVFVQIVSMFFLMAGIVATLIDGNSLWLIIAVPPFIAASLLMGYFDSIISDVRVKRLLAMHKQWVGKRALIMDVSEVTITSVTYSEHSDVLFYYVHEDGIRGWSYHYQVSPVSGDQSTANERTPLFVLSASAVLITFSFSLIVGLEKLLS